MKTGTLKKLFRKALCLVLSVSVPLTGLLPTTAASQSVFCDAWAVMRGADNERCGVRTVGGNPVVYPNLRWERVADLPYLASTAAGARAVAGGSQAVNIANKAALALKLAPSDVASMVQQFPSNVPYVFARYDPPDATLRIDMFLVKKYLQGTEQRVGLYVSQFGPAHGDMWKAHRSYISPEAYKAGVQPGLNPFEAFKSSGNDNFANISLVGAKVAVGHAMRLVGAPLGVLAVYWPDIPPPETRSWRAGLKRKTETKFYGTAETKWYLAQPANLRPRATIMQEPGLCATNVQLSGAGCPWYEVANSGVSFEEFDGGTLSSFKDKWLLDTKTESSLSFIGALFVGLLLSFAGAALLAAAGVGSIGTAAGTVAAGGSTAASASTGLFGLALNASNAAALFSQTYMAVAFEAAVLSTGFVLSGANLSSSISASGSLGLGYASTVQPGYQASASELSEYAQKLQDLYIRPKTVNALTVAPGPVGEGAALTSFEQTLYGNCPLNSICATGAVQRAHEYVETNEVNYVRDNNGALLRGGLSEGPLPY